MNQLTEQDLHEMYSDMLDCEGPVEICGLTLNPSKILKEMDPIAYLTGFNDWLDSELDNLVYEHSDGNYYDEPEDEDDLDEVL